MNQTNLISHPPRRAEHALARLGGSHGYRFAGDEVTLNAQFAVLDPAAHTRNWALQLWACPQAPTSAEALTGHRIAEAVLPPIGEIADEIESFEVRAFAHLPAGSGEHRLVLALVAGENGQFNEIHDLAVYARPESFWQPQLLGGSAYRIEGDRVEIAVEGIFNPRPFGNLSGTLALELWALPAPFQGGSFRGEPLAGVTFDALFSQLAFGNKSFILPFTEPSVGTWNVVLMLREWTSAGFVTRDFVNFALPYVVAAPAPVAEKPVAPQPVSKPISLPAKVVATTPAKKAPRKDAPAAVSINTATLEELALVKNLSKKNAEAIVAGRPYRSVNELLKVKGFGEKLLAKVRPLLKV